MKTLIDLQDRDAPPALSDHFSQLPRRSPNIKLTRGIIGGVFVLIAAVSLNFGLRQYHQFQQEQRSRSLLEQAEGWKGQKNYQGCMIVAAQIPPDTTMAGQAEQLEADCKQHWISQQLQRPQALAQAGRYSDAIAAIQLIPGEIDKIDDGRIAALMEDCSQSLMQVAERYYLDPAGRLDDAIASLKAIPVSSRFHQQAVDQSQAWQSQWSANQAHWQASDVALRTGDLETAQTALAQITDHPFWKIRVDAMIQQIVAQQHRRNLVAQTQQFLAKQRLQEVSPIPNSVAGFSASRAKDPPSTQVQPELPSMNLSLDRLLDPSGRINLGSLSLLVFLASVFFAIDPRRWR